MTYREYYAGQALASNIHDEIARDGKAKKCIELAETLCEALGVNPEASIIDSSLIWHEGIMAELERRRKAANG